MTDGKMNRLTNELVTVMINGWLSSLRLTSLSYFTAARPNPCLSGIILIAITYVSPHNGLMVTEVYNMT